MIPRRKILPALLVAALPCLAFQCGDREPCPSEYSGRLALRPASRQWLPAPAPDSLRFVSSNGFRAVLARVGPAVAPADSMVLSAYPNGPVYGDFDEQPTEESIPCGPYFRAERVRYEYQGRNLALRLRFALRKVLQDGTQSATVQTPLSKAVADTLADVVMVTFNRQQFAYFPVTGGARPPRPAPPNAAGYLDSVRLVGRTFFGVYRSPYLAYGSGVELQYLYFRPGQGLVGFTYSNNEEWARF